MRATFARALVLVTLAISTTTAAFQSSARPLQIEDYYRIKSVGAPQISPDGRWVVFTVSQRLEDDPTQKRRNQSVTQAFVVSTAGTAQPLHLQHDGREVSNLRWTEESWVQYAVGPRVFKVPPAGGTPVVLAQRGEGRGGGPASGGGRGGGAPSAIPSPDGSMVVELHERPLPTSSPEVVSDFEKRHQERFEGAIFDWKDFQRDGAPFPAPNPVARAALFMVVRPSEAVGGSANKPLVDRDVRPGDVVWHPDGRMIAFTADAKWRDELRYAKSDLWTVTLEGKVTQLTDDGYNYADIGFAPDGKYLSYARTFGTDMIIQQKLDHGGPRDLYLRPLTGSGPINLTADWDLEPGDSRWSPDGKYLYFTAGIGGETHLFRVNTPAAAAGAPEPGPPPRFTPAVEQLTKGPRRVGSITYDKGMTRIAYTVTTHDSPGEVYVANIDGSGERRLSNVHADFTKAVALSKADRLQWASKDGTKIEGWLMYPHGFVPSTRAARSGAAARQYPLIVFSHGGPHSATGYSFDFKKQYFAANGYFVLDTNFRSSTGYGEKFKWATWGAWGDKDGEDVVSGVEYVLSQYPIDPRRIGHTGHSYGGFLTNWLITQYPERFAAAISGAGISNWISDYGTADIYRTKETEFFGTPWEEDARNRMIRQSPLTYAGRVKTPTLFVHGEVDQRVPYEEAEQMYFALKRRGVPAKMIQYAGQAHGISGHNNVVHRMINELAWWEKYLKPARASTDGAGR